jgi:membrane-associated phospholipid phosphatase
MRVWRWQLLVSLLALVLVVALGAIIEFRGNTPLALDAEWMDEIIEHRSRAWEVPSLVMNFLGGGWFGVFVVPVAVIVVLVIRKRFVGALYFGVASAMSALVVQILKNVFDRPRPSEILVTADIGSFPSGHVANAATITVALGLITWRTWVWAVGAIYVVVMALSRTYLGAHWLSDTVGGMLVGAAVAMILWIAFANRIRVEKERRGQ